MGSSNKPLGGISIGAFIFNFMYYIAKGNYLVGLYNMLICLILPKGFYFFIGMAFGFFRNNSKEKSSRFETKNILLACCSMVVYMFLKYFVMLVIARIGGKFLWLL